MTLPPLAPAALLHLTIVLMVVWAATDHPLWMAPAALAAGGAVFLLAGRHRAVRWALVALVAAITAGFLAEAHLHRVSADWSRRAVLWEADVRQQLAGELDDLLLAGEEAAGRLVAQFEGVDELAPATLPSDLRPVGVDAVGVFGPGGELLAWDGNHQGPIPRPVRLGLRPYAYEEGALFGYLYVIRPLSEGRGTAMAATLLRADLPASLEDLTGDFVSRFHNRTGAEIQVARSDRVQEESVWDLRWAGDVLFSVTLTRPSEAAARERLEHRWKALVLLLLLFGWGLLAWGSRRQPGGLGISAVALVVALPMVPLGSLLGGPRLFSPADFLLPGPLLLSLGDLLVLGLGAVFLFGFLRPERVPRVPAWGSAAAGTGMALGLLILLGSGASRDLLAAPETDWVLFQATAAVTLAAFLLPFLVAGRRSAGDLRAPFLALGVALSLLMGFGGAWWVRNTGSFPLAAGWLWAVPLLLASRAMGADDRWRAGVLRWVAVVVVSGTLVLPWAWGERVEARIAVAEERIETLGTRADPFLEFLLLRTGEEARAVARTGRNPVEVLYSAWTESGLAREGVPVWLTWWSPEGIAREELRIGVSILRPIIPVELILQALAEDRVRLQRFDLSDAHYMAAAPTADGAVVTAVIPPRRGLSAESPLGPLFTPARTEPDPLVLIPMLPGERSDEEAGVRWVSTRDGLQGEMQVQYPGELFHGHYRLELPGGLLLVARGSLLLLLTLTGVLLLWTGGRRLSTGPGDGPRGAVAALTSFRGRVTMALFCFFLLPTVIFGMLAYQTLAGASVRTAEALAARAVDDAASWFFDVEGALELLASRVGSDLLLYDGGQLVGGSTRELVQLGLYEGWLPPTIQQEVGRGEELTATSMATLGGWEYVMAYQRLPGGLVLAAPSPLQAGATAVRQREIADLLGFALLLGAGLSVLLALGVGRALTRPIQTLQVASERVGSGNMGVHLPDDRTDEFGAVFAAFNRMVDRLARTRRALVTSSRRTRAIVEEVATGVVALDAQGRVTLANPRAEELLGVRLAQGQPLPRPDEGHRPSLTGLREWTEGFLRDGLQEAGTEIPVEERRIRVRARRISRQGPPGGVVLAFEDVTDELRSERILAWGEMAQQVAHEVKNPLTPIKLGIQHIRRTWRDGSEDYEEILDRNVDAILLEIERLASVASSFSRYAAPSPVGTTPLGPVEIERVVREVMDLYSAGEGHVRFRADLPTDLPRVRARAGELKEVLVNLLENARSAIDGEGEVRIEAEMVGEKVSLRVHDEGRGIPPSALQRIFEPHFSTRTSGSGLGLAIVRRLVESWGGRARVAESSDRGTVMELRLLPWVEPGPGTARSMQGGGIETVS